MNILIYRMPSYVIIWKSYTLLKMVQFFWPTLYMLWKPYSGTSCTYRNTETEPTTDFSMETPSDTDRPWKEWQRNNTSWLGDLIGLSCVYNLQCCPDDSSTHVDCLNIYIQFSWYLVASVLYTSLGIKLCFTEIVHSLCFLLICSFILLCLSLSYFLVLL